MGHHDPVLLMGSQARTLATGELQAFGRCGSLVTGADGHPVVPAGEHAQTCGVQRQHYGAGLRQPDE